MREHNGNTGNPLSRKGLRQPVPAVTDVPSSLTYIDISKSSNSSSVARGVCSEVREREQGEQSILASPIPVFEECPVEDPGIVDSSLRLLARMLVAAARSRFDVSPTPPPVPQDEAIFAPSSIAGFSRIKRQPTEVTASIPDRRIRE